MDSIIEYYQIKVKIWITNLCNKTINNKFRDTNKGSSPI